MTFSLPSILTIDTFRTSRSWCFRRTLYGVPDVIATSGYTTEAEALADAVATAMGHLRRGDGEKVEREWRRIRKATCKQSLQVGQSLFDGATA